MEKELQYTLYGHLNNLHIHCEFMFMHGPGLWPSLAHLSIVPLSLTMSVWYAAQPPLLSCSSPDSAQARSPRKCTVMSEPNS